MMRSRAAAGLLLFSLLLAAGAALRATVLVPVDFNELTVSAQAIVYGRVIEVRPVVTDDRRRVESVVVVEALGYMKGDLGRSITFRVPGGQVGAFRTVMVGAPVFTPGEEVVLFLRPQVAAPEAAVARSGPSLVGFSQGVFRVRMEERSGRRLVLPGPAVNLGQTAPIKRGTRAAVTLEAFAAQVKAVAGGGAR